MLKFIVILVEYLVGILLACWLCDINPAEYYEWLSGVWHGLMFVPNWLRSLFCDDVLCKAVNYSVGYNVFWWIFCIVSCVEAVIGTFLSFSMLSDD